MEEIYERSDAVIIPLRAGGGTRIKALEAFSYQKPVISTSIGMEGIRAQNESHVLIGDTASQFAFQCLRLMKNHPLRKKLADNSFTLVRELYALDKLGERISQPNTFSS